MIFEHFEAVFFVFLGPRGSLVSPVSFELNSIRPIFACSFHTYPYPSKVIGDVDQKKSDK